VSLFLAAGCVGEAGGVPGDSLVADYFHPASAPARSASTRSGFRSQRAWDHVWWLYRDGIQLAHGFVSLGSGLLLVPLLIGTLKEPGRGRFDAASARTDAAPFREVWDHLKRNPSSGVVVGAGCDPSWDTACCSGCRPSSC